MIALLTAVFLLFNTQPGDTLTLESEIDAVTVFRNQAQVHRNFEADLRAGTTTLVFTGLSMYVNDRSIQLKGNADFTLISLTTRNNFTETVPVSAGIQALQDKKASLISRIKAREVELEVIQNEINMLQSFQEIIRNNKLSPAELQELLSLYRTSLNDLLTKRNTANDAISALNLELRNINQQINETGRVQRINFKEVVAEVLMETPQQVEFELDYLVNNAGWAPAYDLRAEDIDSPLEITYKAQIRQNTGIDWNDVKFTINSGDPSSNATKPELNTNFIGFYTPPAPVASFRGVEMADEVVVTAAEAESNRGRGLLEDRAKVNPTIIQNTEVSSQTSFSYEIELPYTVPSDGKVHSVDIKRENPATEYGYSSAPKLSPFTYLLAKLPGWDELNIILGQANIYFDNSFVGTTMLDPLSLDDTLSVSLGKDERIVVERNELKEFSSKNFFRNRTRELHAFEIKVRNTKSETVNIVIEDQVPVSTDEDIKVSPKQLSSGSLDEETGIIKWVLVLQPGETKTLRLDYELEYPRGRRIVY